MGKRFAIFLVAATCLCGPYQAGPARAATSSSSIVVTATVLAYCVVTATPMAFGNYASAQLDSAATLAVSCTLGTPYTIGLDQGTGVGATVPLRNMTGTVSGSTLNYSMYSDANRTSVWGNTVGNLLPGTGNGLVQTLTVYGRIPAGQLSAPGLYTDTVTATLSY